MILGPGSSPLICLGTSSFLACSIVIIMGGSISQPSGQPPYYCRCKGVEGRASRRTPATSLHVSDRVSSPRRSCSTSLFLPSAHHILARCGGSHCREILPQNPNHSPRQRLSRSREPFNLGFLPLNEFESSHMQLPGSGVLPSKWCS